MSFFVRKFVTSFGLLPFSIYLVFFPLTLTVSLCIGSTCWSAIYYVDATNGDDINDALSPSAAWKTITKVNNSTFNPGDSVLLKRGEVWKEQLMVPSSGSSNNPVIFGAYGNGDKPIIGGTSTAGHGWTHLGNDVYSIALHVRPYMVLFDANIKPEIFTLQFASLITSPSVGSVLFQQNPFTVLVVTSTSASNNRVFGHISGGQWDTTTPVIDLDHTMVTNPVFAAPMALAYNPAGVTRHGEWCWENGVFYINSTTHPDNSNIEVGARNFGIDTNKQDYLVIKDLEVSGANSAGIFLNETDYSTVQNNTVRNIGVHGFHAGISIWGSCNNKVNGNIISDCAFSGITCSGWDSKITANNTVSQNIISHTGAGGINLISKGVSNNTIENNIISYANELVYDSAGLYSYNTGAGNVFRYNMVHHGGSEKLKSCGLMIDNGSGATDVMYNIFYLNSNGGIHISGDDRIGGDRLYGNTSYRNNEYNFDNGELCFFGGATDSIVKNNIMFSSPGKVIIALQLNSIDGVKIIDYNNYYAVPRALYRLGNTKHDFVDWKKNTGQDLNTLNQDPLFKDPASGDFTLSRNSPCIDAGTFVTLTQDFLGTPVPQEGSIDIGAFEYRELGSPQNLRIGLSH